MAKKRRKSALRPFRPMEKKPAFISILILILSCIIPGLGQIFHKKYRDGIAIFLAFSTAILIALWANNPFWLVVPGLIWIWNILDISNILKGKYQYAVAILWLILVLGVGAQATEFNLRSLIENSSRARTIVEGMFQLDFIQPRTRDNLLQVNIQAPCSDFPPAVDKVEDGLRVTVPEACANVNDTITVIGEGFWPETETNLSWRNPIGGTAMATSTTTDADGRFEVKWTVLPIVHSTAPDPSLPQMHSIKVVQSQLIGGQKISETGAYILQGIYETLALAFLSTILGAVLAIPFAFLAARNLMSGHPITHAIYFIFRMILNITRSIEAMIMAIVFVIIVGLGPFPGMLALTIHTTAALGKLFSEVIEGIDNGQIEAVRATGANWLQVIRFAVIPQVIPSFTGLTIYRWDINVRSSTIIGFVGGGGIGFFLWQWIILQDFSAVGSSFVAIAVVVVILDFFSAKIRERLV